MAQEKEPKEAKKKHIVAKAFRDAPEFVTEGQGNAYKVGDDVSHFDTERLKSLVARGFVTDK